MLCLIYLLTCKQCQKQYTGKTTDDFRYRRKNYKSKYRQFNRKESRIQEYLFRQFSSPGHRELLNDASVTLTDKMEGSDTKKREDYWMKTLKTMTHYGLNTENSVQSYL